MIEVGRMMRSLRHSFTESQVMMHTCIQLRPQSLCSFYVEVAVALKGNPHLTVSKLVWATSCGCKISHPLRRAPPIRQNFPSSISWPFLFCHPQPHSLINFQTARNDSQICSCQPLPCQYTGWLVTLFILI